MMTIKQQRIEELYELYSERFAYMTEHMEYAMEDEDRAIRAFKKSIKMDTAIDGKFDEISTETGAGTAFFIRKLLDAVFPKSISRYVQCLQICGVEVI